MSASDWTDGIVAIYGGSGPVGTGFVVSPEGLILTCAHVLVQAGEKVEHRRLAHVWLAS